MSEHEDPLADVGQKTALAASTAATSGRLVAEAKTRQAQRPTWDAGMNTETFLRPAAATPSRASSSGTAEVLDQATDTTAQPAPKAGR